jgi:xylulokinase
VGSHGAMFLPHMNGAGCPSVDPQSRGGFIGLTGGTTRADMLRALVEGLDYQLLDIMRAMEANLDTPARRFVTVGGATRNAFWMQNKADVLNRRIETTGIEEASPLGAAMLAGIGVGMYKDAKDAYAHVEKPSRAWEPDPGAAARYAKLFPIYRQIAPALRAISHEVQGIVGG